MTITQNGAFLRNILSRAQQNQHPLRGIKITDVQEILPKLANIQDADDWADCWSELAMCYVKDEKESLEYALRYLYIARWPIPNSAKKLDAYSKLKDVFMRYGALLPQKVELVCIPYQQSNIKAYLRHPNSIEASPLILHWGGIDTWKEDLTHLSDAYLSQGWASMVLDMPGTGESPILASPQSEEVFNAVIDYLYQREDINSNKILVQGSSWGGYWATKLAFTQAHRIKGAINWGGPIHEFFSPSWQQKAFASTEYLFDIKEAVCAIYGSKDIDEYLRYNRAMSLQTQKVLQGTSTKMLYINGEKDTLVPIDEIKILKGIDANIDIWTNPEGVHMGVSKEYDHRFIMGKIILPWIEKIFEEERG